MPDGKSVGTFSKTDLAEFYGWANETRLVGDAMTPVVILGTPGAPLERAIELMAFEGDHRLLVLEGEQHAGIVTTLDVLRERAGFPRQGGRVVAVAPPPTSP